MKQIGKYRIEGEIGRGGFGCVYRAFDPQVGRTVAVKVMLGEGDKDLLTRFQNEAKAAGSLKHPNIITIHEAGEFEGKPYLVMEYLEGEDLHHAIARGRPFSMSEKVSIMSQVAEGLHHAHTKNIIHRDVKPANIMVLLDGTVKIMDFGIARVVRERATRITQTGNLIGTVSYMAPEQFRGGDVELPALCDIFAYGGVYYELLTGKHPFRGNEPAVVIYRITSVTPDPILAAAPDCPKELEQIVFKTLEKDPGRRYRSLEELLIDMEPIKDQLEVAAAPQRIAEAERLFQDGHVDEARRIVRKVLKLDPQNRDARRLRESIQLAEDKRADRERAQQLVSAGQQELESGLFAKAIESFEAALQLDSGNTKISQLLKQARAAGERAALAITLLRQARQEFESGDLSSAHQTVLQCLECAPGNEEASALKATIEKEIERREQVAKGIRAAKHLIGEQRWRDAAVLLERLARQFPSEEEIAGLLARCREELRKQADEAARRLAEQQKVEGIAATIAQARQWARTGDFDEAIRTLNRASREFGPEAAFDEVRREIEEQQVLQVRRAAITAAKEEAVRQRAAGRITNAIETLEGAIRTFGSGPSLEELLTHCREEDLIRLREAQILAIVENAAGLVRGKDFENAFQALRRGLEQYSGEPRITAALADAERAKSEFDRAHAIQVVRKRVDLLASQGQLEEAAQAIETALRRLPGESELLELLADVRAEITRREEIRLALAQAQQLLGEDKLEQAEAVLSECDRRHPESADVRGLLGFTRESLAARKRAEEIARTAAHATELLNQNRPHEATTLLKLALEQYPGEERLEVLLARANREVAEVGRQRAVENLLREAETLVEKGRYAEAIAMLDGGIHAYRDDRLGQAKAFAQERARAAEIGRILEEANSQRSRKGLDAAVQCLERGLDRFPGEPEITALLEKVRSEKAEHERKEVVTAAVRRADAAIAKERPEEALEAIDAALRLYAGDRELLEYRAHVEGEAHRLQRERARREQLARLADLAKAARTASSSQELESVAGAAWDLLTPYQHDSEFQETAARVRAEIERRAVRLARPPRAPINKRYLAYGAAAGAVIVIVVAVGLYVKRRPAAPQPEVPPRPALRSAQILEFYASRPVISEGQGVEVCYGVENANEVRLDPPVATLTPASHRCVEVRPAASSEFKLIAKGEDGVESVQSLRITVQAVPAAIGTLVVRTQVDGATVLIDGHPYGRTTESGEVRIPLAPKEYTVGVEKKAYDSPAPRRIRVVADGVHREPFVLQPKPATLTISGAPAGTQVWLDGKPLGSVSGSGTFSVVHGTHTIELVRDRPIYARRTMAFEPGSVVSINRQDLVIPETPAPKPAPPPQEPPLDPRAIAAREWARIQDSRDPAVFEQFLRLPASGPYATAARQKIEQLEWEGVRGRRDIGALQAFIDKYPSGPHRDDAARLMEQLEWGRVNRNDLEALLAFQRKYPNSQQAAAAIERLRVTQRQAGEAQAIVDALNRFARAYETKNVAELTRVWPGIPRGTLRTIRTVFSQARSISMQLRPVGPAQLSNDTAIVRCERSSVTVYDQPRQVTEIITVRLRRGADGWVIEGID